MSDREGRASARESAKMSSAAANNIRSVYLGEGRVGINYGEFFGQPAVFLEPLDHSGEIGADVSPPMPRDALKPHSVVIVLKSRASADVLIEAVNAAMARTSSESPTPTGSGLP